MAVNPTNDYSLMAFSHSIDPSNKLVSVIGLGVVTNVDLARIADAIYADPLFDPDGPCLVDLLGVIRIDLGTDAVVERAKKRRFSSLSRTAIVTKDQLAYGLSRVYESYSSGGMIHVFRDHQSAVEWINETLVAEHRIPEKSSR